MNTGLSVARTTVRACQSTWGGMKPSVDKDSFPIDIVIKRGGFIEAAPENGGVFTAGCASGALDVNRAAQHATGAALRAILLRIVRNNVVCPEWH